MEATSTPAGSLASKKSYPYMSQSNVSSVQRLSFRNRHFSKSHPHSEKPATKRVRSYLTTLSWNRIQHDSNLDVTQVSPDDEKILLQNEKIWCLLDSETAPETVSPGLATSIENSLSPMTDENGMIAENVTTIERYSKKRNFPSSEYSEWSGNIFETEDETNMNIDETHDSSNTSIENTDTESIISKNYHSDNLESGIPIYKTKTTFNETVKLHFSKFHKRVQNIYETYQKKKSSRANAKTQDGNAISTKNNDGSNFDDLPADAFTCYNQFRTQNFNDVFERYSSGNTSNNTPINDNMPVLSSINELTYEKLKDLKDQFLNISTFSSSSDLNLNAIQEENKTGSKICDINEEELMEALTEESSPQIGIGIFDPFSNRSKLELFSKISSSERDQETEQELSLERSNNSEESYPENEDSNDYIEDEIPIGAKSKPTITTPGIISQLFHASVSNEYNQTLGNDMMDNYQLYPLDWSNSGTSEDTPAMTESSKDGDEQDVVFEDDISITDSDHQREPGSVNTDEQPKSNILFAGTSSSFGAESLNPKSVLKRVRSVFGKGSSATSSLVSNNLVGARISSDNSSNYTPISVVVPALKPNNGLLNNLAGSVYEGAPISSVYSEPSSASTSSKIHETGFDIRNPKRFFSNSSESSYNSTSSSALRRTRTPSIDLMTTIKFDKFAQLLLYDGSKRLKYFTDNSSVRRQGTMNQSSSVIRAQELALQQMNSKMRQEMFKNNGTLVLGSTSANDSFNRLKNIRLSKFSRFSSISGSATLGKKIGRDVEELLDEREETFMKNKNENENRNYYDDEENDEANMTRDSVKSILKSRHNRNVDAETVRALYCDDVDVDDFMIFLESHERKKQETEPYLGRIREKQLLTYYALDEGEQSSTHTTSSTSSTDEYY